MKLAVDVMGFENNLAEALNACIDFKHKNNVDIIVVGDENKIKDQLGTKNNNILEIINATDVIEQNDDLAVIRTKKDSSMLKAIQLVADNKADGVLSAGNSSIFVFLAYQKLGMIEGVNKPGFMPFIPTFDGQGFNILDVGASKECTAEDLYMFAVMANVYASCRNLKNPRIGILNIGTEKTKGFAWQTDAAELINKNKSINYIGYVEPRDLLSGTVDILVSDGYAGNICLKTLEGTVKTIFSNIIAYYKNPLHWLLFPFSASMLLKMKNKFNYKNNAGAFVLGLNKIAVKTHGSADYTQFYSSLRMLKECLDHNILEKIKKEIKKEIKNESKNMNQ